MVSFQCDGCSDTVKKPKLDSHYPRCGASFTCLDCSKTFHSASQWKGHTQCVSEAEKYQKGLYKGPKAGGKGQGRDQNSQPNGKPANGNGAPAVPPPQPGASNAGTSTHGAPAMEATKPVFAAGTASISKEEKREKKKKRKSVGADATGDLETTVTAAPVEGEPAQKKLKKKHGAEPSQATSMAPTLLPAAATEEDEKARRKREKKEKKEKRKSGALEAEGSGVATETIVDASTEGPAVDAVVDDKAAKRERKKERKRKRKREGADADADAAEVAAGASATPVEKKTKKEKKAKESTDQAAETVHMDVDVPTPVEGKGLKSKKERKKELEEGKGRKSLQVGEAFVDTEGEGPKKKKSRKGLSE